MKTYLLTVVALATVALCSAADLECKYRKTRKLALHWADPTDCVRYYRCTNKGVKREVVCAEGKVYNAKTGRCSTNRKGLCKLTLAAPLDRAINPCTDEISGTYISQPGYCRNFYICNNNQAYPQACDAGSRFNDTTGNCVPDPGSECWQNKCIGEASGAYLSDASSCTSFYICSGGEVTVQECTSGSYFNGDIGVCQPDPNGEHCWENLCVSRPDGDFVKDVNDCHYYYVCAAGKPIRQECSIGSYFNWIQNACLPGDCPSDESTTICPTTDTTISSTQCNEVTTSTSKVTTPTLPTDCSCPGGYKEGELVPFPNYPQNCDKFYECLKGKLEEKECGVGNRFDSSLGVCVPDTDNICWPTTECPETTTPASEAGCSCPGGYKEGELVPFPNYPQNCDKFYECLKGKLEEKECGVGNRFDSSLGVCVPDTENMCWPTTERPETTTPASEAGCSCPGGYKEGEIVPFPNYPQNCDKFYECLKGKLEEKECGVGNRFDSSLGVCVPDTDNICWPTTECPETTTPASEAGCSCPGGYKEGELLPFPNYPQNCDKFYECFKGKLEEKECGVGNRFDSSLGVCVPDTDNICWPTTECPETTTPASEAGCFCPGGYKEGELIPFANYPQNCDRYYECLDGNLKEKECGVGNRFDSSLGVCVPDTDNICWPTTECPETTTPASEAGCSCPGGYKEGELLPFPNYPQNCDKFYECFKGKLEEKECGVGNRFDSSLGVCVPDTDNICWPTTECPETTTPASEAGCSCPGGYKEGELIPFPNYPQNCDKFYECLDGKLKEKECGVGNRFDSSLGVCVPDTDNICWPTTELPETTTPASEAGCSCPGGYKEGELIPFPNYPQNCDRYYECLDGKLKEKECGVGNRFDISLGVCVPDADHTCRPLDCHNQTDDTISPRTSNSEAAAFDPILEVSTNADSNCSCPGGYTEGQLLPFPENCSKYYVCTGGKLQEQNCGIGNRFDNSLRACVPDTDNICWPGKINCTCPGGYKEGQLLPFPNCSGNCQKYYICTEGKLQEHDCGVGNRFESSLGVCVPVTDNSCSPNVCKDQPDGRTVSDPTDCTSFYLCEGGQAEIYDCPNEKWFNPVRQICEPDFNATCINPCKDTTGITFLPNPDCTKYFLCNDGLPYVETCSKGGFDINLGKCVDNAVCEATLCLDKEDGTTFPMAGNNAMFYLCLGGVAQTSECPLGTVYQASVGVCLKQPSPDCDQSKCNSSQAESNAFAPLAQTDNTTFCLCRDNAAFLHHCTDDYTFRKDLGICYSNAACDPELCDISPENTRSPNRNDMQSFCLCVSKQPVVVACPNNQTYNPVYRLCQTQDNKCSSTFCSSAPEYTVFPALNNDTNGFCICHSSGTQYKLCGVGQKFNVDRRVCLSTTAEVCSNAVCVGNEGRIIGATDDPNSFCYCDTDGVAIQKSCPNNEIFNKTLLICQAVGCDGQFCLTNPSGPFPALNEPYSFCICASTDPSSVTKYNCGNGTRFDPLYLICLEEPCDKGFCKNVSNDDVPYSANNYPQGFCICSSGSPQLHSCPNGTIFDPNVGICTSPINMECDLLQCANATTENTYAVAAKDDAYGFCYCFSATDVEFFTCPNNALFEPTLGICTVSGSGIPGTSPDNCTCPGGYKEGQVLANPTSCRLYYVCSSGHLQEFDCGVGKYFNKTSAKCQEDICGSCVEEGAAFTCVGAYREGEFAAHRTNKQLFYLCHNEKLTEGDCGPGNFFDIDSTSCQPLDKYHRVTTKHFMRSEVVPDDNFCVENDKHPVPSNCSQYEICLDGVWTRLSCPNEWYYNPEQRKCMEPRDDTICDYARVKNLPICNASMEQRTVPGREPSCAHYYRCNHGRWRFETCPNQHFYSSRLKTCIPGLLNNSCMSRNQTGVDADREQKPIGSKCRHMAVRHFEQNCTMYLMCLEGNWWHQYCPLGMYYNRTHNYCMPDIDGKCANAKLQQEYFMQYCNLQSALRPSGLSCDHYYECREGHWHSRKCAPNHYFNSTKGACLPDTEGFCANFHTATCVEDERRDFPLNCTAYETCSRGEWQRMSCNHSSMYDNILHTCVPNDGSCASNGLRMACGVGETKAHPLAENCTQFYYCFRDNWKVGTCLKGHTYAKELRECVPHDADDQCLPVFVSETISIPSSKDLSTKAQFGFNQTTLCLGREDGIAVSHPESCLHFIVCIAESPSGKQKCASGSFFDGKLGYCKPNDGSCLVPLSGLCANASDGGYIPHPEDCQAYYYCSTLNGTELFKCAEGEYYHNVTGQCRIDHGECRPKTGEFGKCHGVAHGKHMPHEHYCNIYYACVRGLAIAVTCPADHFFSAEVGDCVFDNMHTCEIALLDIHNITTSYSCDNLTDGIHLPDTSDCTKYYVCAAGVALIVNCPKGAFFDGEQQLCVPDDGSCPYVKKIQLSPQPAPPDPVICDGRHGHIMADPANCNEFYVCINGKLRHERCDTGFYFNASANQCQPYEQYIGNGNTTETDEMSNNMIKCNDKPTNYTKLCSQIQGTSIAEQGDCRRYINCNDVGEPVSQRCRNGESYDSLLGFCRQNDGTCLLENGQRVGECSGRHGQFVRDGDNCRGYFVCINGQKISGECEQNEYFDKKLSKCVEDGDNQCGADTAQSTDTQAVSCLRLSDSILYPYTPDNCRSYFQCVQGMPKVHECADGLYFNASIRRCVKDITKCEMPTTTLKRAPEPFSLKTDICEKAIPGQRYANVGDRCRSFYVCKEDGSVAITTCPIHELYSSENRICKIANNVTCEM